MKYSTLFLVLAFVAILPTASWAQAISSDATPALAKAEEQVETKVARQLPPKQIVLLYEINELKLEETAEEEMANSPELLMEDLENQEYELKVLLHLFSTAYLNKIHVKIGSTPGASDFSSHTFTFDEKTSEKATFSYARDGKTIVLGMGRIKGTQQYHAEVVLESKTGQLSEARYFGPQ